MIYSEFEDMHVAGMAVAVPGNEVDVDSFFDQFGREQVLKFKKMTGVERFRITAPEQTVSDLCYVAARQLVEEQKMAIDKIGALIFVTQSPDYRLPATACVLHKRLGLGKDCLVFDVNLGCSGYVYGIHTILSLLQSSNISSGLLLAGDAFRATLSPEDGSAAMLFGDAGSATVFTKRTAVPAIGFSCRTDGNGFRAIIIQGGAYRNWSASDEITEWADGNRRSDRHLFMNGPDVFTFAITEVPAHINEFMKHENTVPGDYEYLVMHQANSYILKQVARKTKFPLNKVAISLDIYGNTSSASIPATIAKIYGEDHASEYRRLLLSGFGVGLSWATASLSVQPANILPVITTSEKYTEGGIIRG